jgi:ABC-type transport system involved in cytochrome bd biosynthesis fused ATPase/permease subunit
VIGAGALRGAGSALLLTAVIGGTALLLEFLWPWLAWGYVLVALALGAVLCVASRRAEKALEREVEQVRRRYRSG